jgi:hypothetical protein
MDEDGVWCRAFGENDVRVIVPTELQETVLHKVPGSKARGTGESRGRRRWYVPNTIGKDGLWMCSMPWTSAWLVKWCS